MKNPSNAHVVSVDSWPSLWLTAGSNILVRLSILQVAEEAVAGLGYCTRDDVP